MHDPACPEGAFRVSQDADLKPGEHAAEYFQLDDAGRRAEGIPRVDENLYSRENGMMIEALLVLFEFTGDRTLLDRANKATTWVARHRLNADGGFRHDQQELDARYLADNLAMARALLQWYRVTADRRFLRAAIHTARYMNRHFRQSGAGVLLVRGVSGPLSPVPEMPRSRTQRNTRCFFFGNRAGRSCCEYRGRHPARRSRTGQWSAAPDRTRWQTSVGCVGAV
jgi:uncharacterized protein